MPKIVHVITGLRRGGAEGVLTRLVHATRPEFEHVVVALREEGHYGPLLRGAGITVYALDIDGQRNVISGLSRLVRLIGQERPDIVQTWLYHADVLGGLAARLAGVRHVIWSIRNTNLDTGSISRATRAVAWFAARVSRFIPARIVYNSVRSRSVHEQFGYSARQCQVIQNGYDLEVFRPDPAAGAALRVQLGVRPDDCLVGCVARWDRQKDHANLLAALGSVSRRRPGLRVLLVGSGMDAANDKLARLLGAATLDTRAILAGPRDDIPSVMNALDLHILSSAGEAFPNVVAEAMACGTACVATDVGDAAHIIGDTGWLVPPRDSNALAGAIETALDSLQRQSREIFGARCRARVLEHFGLQTMTDSYRSLWRGLVTSRN